MDHSNVYRPTHARSHAFIHTRMRAHAHTYTHTNPVYSEKKEKHSLPTYVPPILSLSPPSLCLSVCFCLCLCLSVCLSLSLSLSPHPLSLSLPTCLLSVYSVRNRARAGKVASCFNQIFCVLFWFLDSTSFIRSLRVSVAGKTATYRLWEYVGIKKNSYSDKL